MQYHLTHIGFGLNSAPKTTSSILGKVVSLDVGISEATNCYIDDIILNLKKTSGEYVVNHLARYGLITKEPEECSAAGVLGLQLFRKEKKELGWERNIIIPTPEDFKNEKITRRRLFSICGHLIEDYPVGNWLRIACSFTKRHSLGEVWDDLIGDQVQSWLVKTLR